MVQPSKLLLTTVCALALAGAAASAAAQSGAGKGPRFAEEDDKFVLENEHVTVWFQGKKPILKLFRADNASGEPLIAYKLTEVVEYRDVDADGAPAATEVVAKLNLERANAYEVQHVEVEDGVVLNLTLEAPVTLGGPLADRDVPFPDRTAIVSLVFTIRAADAELSVGNATVLVPSTAIKYDLIVAKWPWVDAEANRLALESRVTGALDVNATEGVEAAVVTANGTAVGGVSWTRLAQGTLANGTAVDVPVIANVTPVAEKDGEDRASPEARVTFTYDAPGLASLVHDPVVGIASVASAESSDVPDVLDRVRSVPTLPLGALVGAVAVAAVAFRRRG